MANNRPPRVLLVPMALLATSGLFAGCAGLSADARPEPIDPRAGAGTAPAATDRWNGSGS